MKERFYSLDVFRGATVALMILVNNPGSWEHIYPPLEHAAWHGCTPTDLVFPFFLFAVGNALAFVIPGLEQKGNAAFLQKVIKRALLIFFIGLLLNWSPFVKWQNDHLIFKTFEKVRILGVLQRIAICYFFASLIIFYCKLRLAMLAGMIILLLYWWLCLALGNASDPYSINGWFGTRFDMMILGEKHMYHGEGIAFDPEGLMSSFAAIVQVIFGYLVGLHITQKGKNAEMLNGLFIAGVACIVTGFCWDMVFPVNKKIWTSSYTIYTTGLAILTIATMIHMIEFRNVRGWLAKFFDVFGKNPLFIFVLSGLLPRLLGLIRIPGWLDEQGQLHYFSPFSWFYERVCALIPGDPRIGSLAYALCMIIFYWFIAWLLDRKKIYIKV